MKKILALLLTLVTFYGVSLTTIPAYADTPVVGSTSPVSFGESGTPTLEEDPGVCSVHYEWWTPGIREWQRDAGGGRVFKFRVALRLKYCGTIVTAVQWYEAITCTYQDGPQACSFNYFGELRQNGNPVDHECGHTAGGTIGDCALETTGDDGYVSWYGSEIAVGSTVCYDWEAYGQFSNVGIRGVHPDWSAQGLRTIPEFNRCA